MATAMREVQQGMQGAGTFAFGLLFGGVPCGRLREGPDIKMLATRVMRELVDLTEGRKYRSQQQRQRQRRQD